MTLKEKFKQVINYQFMFGLNQNDKMERAAQNNEKIADDYAIDFYNWVVCESDGYDFMNKTTSELLEIFKKEKGL